jgi:hypothetical protein
MTSHFNTTHETGQTLISFEAKAVNQESTVLEVFYTYCRPLTWSEVQRLLPTNMNEISIKRSLSVLKNKRILEKTSEKVQGIYGRPNFKYKLI